MTFSISVPVGAWHPFLPTCLESLRRQDAPLQVSLLDASGDERVKALADRYDDLFAYRRHGPDAGQAAAIMEGWRKTDGDILGWLNADDILFPNALATAQTRLSDGPFDLVYGRSTFLDEEGRMTGYQSAVQPPSDLLLEAAIISQPSCFFRRSAYDAVGGMNADLHYTMDWDLFIRIYQSGARFGFIDAPLSLILMGEDTKTSTFNAQRRNELKAIITKHAPVERRRTVFTAFAVQNMLDRARPQIVQRLLNRIFVRGRGVVYGLAADGTITDEAALHLAHYDEKPKTGARLRLSDPGAVEAVAVGGVRVATTAAAGALDVSFAEPMPAGVALRLTIQATEGRPAEFISCELL